MGVCWEANSAIKVEKTMRKIITNCEKVNTKSVEKNWRTVTTNRTEGYVKLYYSPK